MQYVILGASAYGNTGLLIISVDNYVRLRLEKDVIKQSITLH